MDLPYKGSLRDINFPEILLQLHSKKATGILSVASEGFKKNIILKDGDTIFSSSTLIQDRLGEMLVRAGKITGNALADAASLLKIKNKRLGAILVDLGHLSPEELFWGVKYQVKEIILSLFCIDKGTYEFCEGCIPDDEVITLKIKMQDIIDEGIRRRGRIAQGKHGASGAGSAFPDKSVKEESTGDSDAFIARVNEFYNKLKKMSADELLGIDENTGSADIKRNYYRHIKVFHPDIVFNSDNREIKIKVNAIFDALTKSYHLLRDDERRRAYFRSGRKAGEEGFDNRSLIIQEQMKRGIEEFRGKNYHAAVEIFRWLKREEPKNHKILSYLALTLSMMPRRLKEAEETMLEAIRLEPLNSDYHAELGNIYLKAGLKKRAKTSFERALKLAPENEKAKNGLRLTNNA